MKKVRKTIQVKAEISTAECARLDRIIEKYAFKSRYQVVQYLIKSFLKVADPQIDEESIDEEIGRMFGDFESAGSEDFQNVKRGGAI